MIFLKSKDELDVMRRAGKLLSSIVEQIKNKIKIGVVTKDIDKLAEEIITGYGAVPAFKGYHGFPAAICTSINDEVVHGIPSQRRLKDGDLLKIDIGIKLDGYFSDYAFTIGLGRIDERSRSLVEATKKSLVMGIAQAKESNHLSDISWAIQKYIESRGFSVVRDFVGHGIGRDMHEAPEVPNFGLPHNGPVLKEGLVLAIEPMVNMGTWEVKIQENGWTAVTKDSLNSAHFEHTVAVTATGPEILTES